MPITQHQLSQQQVINQIEQQIAHQAINFTTVSPVTDYAHDPRICLTSVHLLKKNLIQQIQTTLIQPLKNIEPNLYYYPNDCLHMTIKNIRIVHDKTNFTAADVQKAKNIFNETIPLHQKFKVYFYRLLLFPNNLALIGTTDAELDQIILDLDKKLTAAGIPDNKTYANAKYFFSNITLARFNQPVSTAFKQQVVTLSRNLKFEPYQVDTVSLLTCNAVLKNKHLQGTWKLRD